MYYHRIDNKPFENRFLFRTRKVKNKNSNTLIAVNDVLNTLKTQHKNQKVKKKLKKWCMSVYTNVQKIFLKKFKNQSIQFLSQHSTISSITLTDA